MLRVAASRLSVSSSTASLAARTVTARILLPTVVSATHHFSTTAAAAVETPKNPPVTPNKPEKVPFVSSTARKYEFFENVTVNADGVALVRFDCPGKPVNTISFKLADEAKVLWQQEIASNPTVKAVVFGSAKPGMFIAGADIFDIQSIQDKQTLVPLIADGLQFFQDMKASGLPLVAAIDGPALGGGLEWALWCDARICSDSPKTKLGLPEVKLGLLPGFGGTQNLPKTVGVQAAMDMMLTGKEIRPKKAKQMGLVDLVVAPASLEQVALATAAALAQGNKSILKKKPKSLMNRLLEDTSLGRAVIWNQVEKMIAKNTAGNYPAPTAIVACAKYGLDHPNSQSRFEQERQEFATLAATPESAALIGLFDGMTQMKKHAYGKEAALPVKQVAVLGAGLMGAGIAQVSAEKAKLQVVLKDRHDEAVARGLDYCQGNWKKQVSRKRMTSYQYNTHTARLTGITEAMPSWQRHLGQSDLVVEAVFEDLALKQQIVADLEAVCSDDCILATNTSALPIRSIAEKATRPENILGMHYFSPVPSMPLLEIIPHAGTSDRAIATAFEVGTAQGKTCMIVQDVPGFYVNRCLGPYLMEVSALVRDGIPLEQLDASMVQFGMPVGPMTLADEVGLDVTSHVATFLAKADLGVRMTGGDVSLMQNMIDKGWLGKKSGQGFYTYKGKKKTINPEVQAYVKDFATRKLTLSSEEIANRIVSRFVNEAVKCLEDDIIESPMAGDIGMVFGTGFAPFRGGPFRYLDQVGAQAFCDQMDRLTEEYGPQFAPTQLLRDRAQSGQPFHA